MPGPARSTRVSGPVAPTPEATVRRRPLGDGFRLTGGMWRRWQDLNRSVSIPLGMRRLDDAGNFANLGLAGDGVTGAEAAARYQGPRFMDSDLYKAVEAIGWETGREPADDLAAFVERVGALAERAQRDDGYLNSYYQTVGRERQYTELNHSHEMYCAGHLIQAAIAVTRAGTPGGDRVLAVARRFADHLVAEFGTGDNPGIDGHPEIETALMELYRETGEGSYLDLARQLLEGRGHGRVGGGRNPSYFQDHETIRKADTLIGHAVRALYLEAGVVDLAVETGDDDLLAASIARWEDMVAAKTALTGGVGSRHSREAFGDRYELPPDRAYNETCAAIASIHWSWRLLLATGQSRYADLIERTLYNGFAASTSADGERFFYVNPLQRRFDHLEGDDPGRRHEWYSCACCPPNIMRLVSSFGHYVATSDDTGVQIHQYAGGTLRAGLGSGEVAVEVETDYPWSGAVGVTVREAPGGSWRLALRRPAWSRHTNVTVNGVPVQDTADDDGYLVVEREWAAGDVVQLDLDLTPRVVRPYHRIDALRGCVAVERGPLVYCVEQVDQVDGADVDDLRLVRGAEPVAERRADFGGGPTVALTVDGVHVTKEHPGGLPYRTTDEDTAPARSRPVPVTLVPYFQWDNRDGRPMRVWLPLADEVPSP